MGSIKTVSSSYYTTSQWTTSTSASVASTGPWVNDGVLSEAEVSALNVKTKGLLEEAEKKASERAEWAEEDQAEDDEIAAKADTKSRPLLAG